MTTIIRAHGQWDGQSWTFLPDGTTMKFYSDENQVLYTSQAIAVLSQAGWDNYNDMRGPGNKDNENPAWVQNYYVTPRSSGEMQRDLSADAGGARIMFVGDKLTGPTYLCTGTPGPCRDGEHKCTGILGQIKDDTDLIYMACRGVEGENSPMTQGIGPADNRDRTMYDETLAWHAWFVETLAKDPAAVESDFDGRGQVFQAEMLAWPDVKAWSFVREARRFALQDPEGFAKQVAAMKRDNSDAEALRAYLADPELAQVIRDVESGETWTTG